MNSSSEDEFDRARKKLVCGFDKENIPPNVTSCRSPLLEQLDEISFNSDFMDDKCNKVCDTLWENIPFHEKQPVTKRQRNQIDRKNAKRNAAVLHKTEPYTGVRTKRSGCTLFELVEKTNTDSKVITFLQEHGCLRTEMSCPSCGEAMVQTDRVDGGLPQSVFRCSKRHGPEKKRCNVRKTVRSNSFFYNANISLFTFV